MYKTPKFWYISKKTSLLIYLFYPVSLIWLFFAKYKFLLNKKKELPIPVICVGNLTIGGNGKTPTVIALQKLLQNLNFNPHVVSRGYGGNFQGPHQVYSNTNSHFQVGDEALIINNHGPNWISKNRRSGVFAAYNAGADVIILDDGFQNPSIYKDISLIVVDAKSAFGNGHIIPSGPLREPIEYGLKRADIILLLGTQTDREKAILNWPILDTRKKILGELKPAKNINFFKQSKLIAFAGIGKPEKFFKMLENFGAILLETIELPNHKQAKRSLLSKLLKKANSLKATIVTTEKDYVKLPSDFKPFIKVIPIKLVFEDYPKVEEYFYSKIKTS